MGISCWLPAFSEMGYRWGFFFCLKINNRPIIYFAVNTSLVKLTLRSNNRALAKALEAKREELAATQQALLQLQVYIIHFYQIIDKFN